MGINKINYNYNPLHLFDNVLSIFIVDDGDCISQTTLVTCKSMHITGSENLPGLLTLLTTHF